MSGTASSARCAPWFRPKASPGTWSTSRLRNWWQAATRAFSTGSISRPSMTRTTSSPAAPARAAWRPPSGQTCLPTTIRASAPRSRGRAPISSISRPGRASAGCTRPRRTSSSSRSWPTGRSRGTSKVLATEKGVDRAFRKLDTIKKDIVWWEAGAQPMQLLADGQVVMTTAYGGRVWTAIHQDKKPFVVVWHNQIYDMDWWAIPKGAPHKKTALEFIKFASEPSILKNQSKWVGVGPAVKSAIPLVDKSIMKDLPTDPSNLHDALSNDAQFWADHFDSLNQRFQAWLAK